MSGKRKNDYYKNKAKFKTWFQPLAIITSIISIGAILVMYVFSPIVPWFKKIGGKISNWWDGLKEEQDKKDKRLIHVDTVEELKEALIDGYNVKLKCDIDLSGVDWSDVRDETYSYEFNGNGHIILNLTVTGDCASLFGILTGATVKDLKLENVNVSGGNYIGALAGKFGTDKNTISNVEIVSGTVGDYESKYVGGVVGYIPNVILTNVGNVTNRATVTGDSWVGGFCGWYHFAGNDAGIVGGVNNITNYGNVEAVKRDDSDNSSGNAGGIFGVVTTFNAAVSFNNLKNYGTVTCENNYYTGGIVGNAYFKPKNWYDVAKNNKFTLTNCHNSGDINGNTYVGGLLGQLGDNYVSGTFTNCVNNGKVYGKNSYVGGIVGRVNESPAIFTSCTNSASSTTKTISGQSYVGGICGANGTRYANCKNTMIIELKSSSSSQTVMTYAGGITGYTYAEMVGCENTGKVFGNCEDNSTKLYKFIGGIVGKFYAYNADSKISSCTNSGLVQGNYAIGGIVGECYSASSYDMNFENNTSYGSIKLYGTTSSVSTSYEYAYAEDDASGYGCAGALFGAIRWNGWSNIRIVNCTVQNYSGGIYVYNNARAVGGFVGLASFENATSGNNLTVVEADCVLNISIYTDYGATVVNNDILGDVNKTDRTSLLSDINALNIGMVHNYYN